jgi:hypothetical protein
VENIESANLEKGENAKREKLEEALIRKMQLNAENGTATDGFIKGRAEMMRKYCTLLLHCMFF